MVEIGSGIEKGQIEIALTSRELGWSEAMSRKEKLEKLSQFLDQIEQKDDAQLNSMGIGPKVKKAYRFEEVLPERGFSSVVGVIPLGDVANVYREVRVMEVKEGNNHFFCVVTGNAIVEDVLGWTLWRVSADGIVEEKAHSVKDENGEGVAVVGNNCIEVRLAGMGANAILVNVGETSQSMREVPVQLWRLAVGLEHKQRSYPEVFRYIYPEIDNVEMQKLEQSVVV